MTYLDILKKFDKALLTENIRLKKIYNQLVSESGTEDFDLAEVETPADDGENTNTATATETPKSEGIEVDAQEENIGECGKVEDDSDVDLLMKESDGNCCQDDKKKKELKEAKKFFEEMEHEDDAQVKEDVDGNGDDVRDAKPETATRPGLTPEEFYKLKESNKKACDCGTNGEDCKCKDGECVGEDFMKPTSESCGQINESPKRSSMLPTQAWQVVQDKAKENVELAFGLAGMYWWDVINDGKPEVLKDPACRKFNKLMGAEKLVGDEYSDPQFADKLADKAKRRKNAARKMLAFHDKFDGTPELVNGLMALGYDEKLANARSQSPDNIRGNKTETSAADEDSDDVTTEAELKPGKDAFADTEPKNVPDADDSEKRNGEEKPVEKKSVADSLPEDGESALEEAAEDQENPDVSKFFQVDDGDEKDEKPETPDETNKGKKPVKKETKPEEKEEESNENKAEGNEKKENLDESTALDCNVPTDDEVVEDTAPATDVPSKPEEVPSKPAEDETYETEVVEDPEEEAAVAESIKNLVKMHKEMFS